MFNISWELLVFTSQKDQRKFNSLLQSQNRVASLSPKLKFTLLPISWQVSFLVVFNTNTLSAGTLFVNSSNGDRCQPGPWWIRCSVPWRNLHVCFSERDALLTIYLDTRNTQAGASSWLDFENRSQMIELNVRLLKLCGRSQSSVLDMLGVRKIWSSN